MENNFNVNLNNAFEDEECALSWMRENGLIGAKNCQNCDTLMRVNKNKNFKLGECLKYNSCKKTCSTRNNEFFVNHSKLEIKVILLVVMRHFADGYNCKGAGNFFMGKS